MHANNTNNTMLCEERKEHFANCTAIAKLSAHLCVIIANYNIIATEYSWLNPKAAPKIKECTDNISHANKANAGWFAF